MRTLVLYASRYGLAADCAEYLKANLPGDVTLADVETGNLQLDLEAFDTVILGASVYVGKISKKMRAFCEGKAQLLLQKRLGIFLCCAQAENLDTFLTANFPAALLAHASVTKAFGSEARLEKMRTFDKLIIKAVTKGNFSSFRILNENRETFVREISSS